MKSMFRRTSTSGTTERPGYPFPRIAQSDYETLRQLMGDRLPATYEDWVDFIDFRRRDEIMRHPVMDIDVDPDEFRRYVGTDRQYDYGTLTEYLMQKVRGRRF